jgi:hypothetical protein
MEYIENECEPVNLTFDSMAVLMLRINSLTIKIKTNLKSLLL